MRALHSRHSMEGGWLAGWPQFVKCKVTAADGATLSGAGGGAASTVAISVPRSGACLRERGVAWPLPNPLRRRPVNISWCTGREGSPSANIQRSSSWLHNK
jgi:hypothetical protein